MPWEGHKQTGVFQKINFEKFIIHVLSMLEICLICRCAYNRGGK